MLHQTRVYGLTRKYIHVLSTDKENIKGQILPQPTLPHQPATKPRQSTFSGASVADPDLPIRRGVGHPDPEITRVGTNLQKKISALRLSVGLKIRWGGLPWIRHWASPDHFLRLLRDGGKNRT